MHVFTANDSSLHAPTWYVADGTTRPCPDDPQRIGRIVQALAAAGHEVVTLAPAEIPLADASSTAIELGKMKPANAPWPALIAVHTSDYLEYLRTIHDDWRREFGVDVLPDTFPRFNRVTASKRPTKGVAQAGWYCFDMAAPIAAGTWRAALAGATCAVRAAGAVAQGARAAYALCRPPGHHAGADYCGGFCYLNNAAIAGQHLRMAGKRRVAVLDIDYHHGNGTQDIFYARDDVLFVSLHAEPDTQYPYFWGHAGEIGAGRGEGFNHNFPLPRGTGEAAWLETLSRALGIVGQYSPEALVVSLGVDTYEKDTVGDFGVSLSGFGRAAEAIRQLGAPLVIVQEGGYNLDAVGPCVAAFLSSF